MTWEEGNPLVRYRQVVERHVVARAVPPATVKVAPVQETLVPTKVQVTVVPTEVQTPVYRPAIPDAVTNAPETSSSHAAVPPADAR
jgi:hypothetical protein